MITAVNYSPPIYMSSFNPIMWSVTSDKINETDFKYVFDITVRYTGYIFGALDPGTYETFRVKTLPNQTGCGVVDVSPTIQKYVNYSKYSNEEGNVSLFKPSDDITPIVFITVGEEYRTGTGSLTIYNGLTATPGNPLYFPGNDTHSPSLPYSSAWVYTIPAALNHNDNTDLMTMGVSASWLSAYSGMGTSSVFPESFTGKFLKRDSNIIEVGINDRHSLSIIGVGFATIAGVVPYPTPIRDFVVNYYDQLGNLSLSLTYSNPYVDPGFIGNADTYIGSVLTSFRCGPKDLQIVSQTYSYYEVTVRGFLKYLPPIPFTFGTASETVRFNIVDYCEDLYPKIRLSWLNDLGGRDYYNFTMFYEESSNSTERNYNQTTMNWTQTTPVVIPASSVDSSSNWRRGGNKSFNKNVVRRFTIQSDYLDQEKVDFLSGIPESPSVWAYIGTQSVPYTVTVTNTEYTNKYVKQQKLVQVSFDCTLTKTQQKQNS